MFSRIALLAAGIVAVVAIGVVPASTADDGVLSHQVTYLGGNNAANGGHVVVEGNRLYVGAYGLGFQIFDISDKTKPTLLGSYLPGGRADAPPDAAVFDGRHIAVLNGTNRLTQTSQRTDRTEFFDVTNPANPRKLWEFVAPPDGESHNGDIVDKRRIWLPSGLGGTNGLRIYDLNPLLQEPPAAPAILFRGNPTTMWQNSPYRKGRPVGATYTHTHDIEVYTDFAVEGLGRRDIAFLAEGGAYANNNGNTGSVFIIDITDPRNPVVLQRWLHATGAGHHPIRYHHEVQILDGDKRLMLVTDEDLHNGCGGAGGVTAVRLSPDLQRSEEVSEWFIPTGTAAPICSVHVFTSYRKLAFFGSYNAGLQVVDYRDPANPVRVGYAIMPGTTAWGAMFHKGVVYVGDMARGLDVFRYLLPDLTGSALDISFSNTSPRVGDTVGVTAVLKNAGDDEATGVTAQFLDNGVPFATATWPRIGPGETVTANVTWDTSQAAPGEHRIRIKLDPNDLVTEDNELNNDIGRKITLQ